jgi:hypothetical protein
VTAADESPEVRLARWIRRDAEIGLAAQRDQLLDQLAARDREIADLRERLAHLTNALGQLRAEKAKLVGLVQRSGSGSISRQAYRRLRSMVGRTLRS